MLIDYLDCSFHSPYLIGNISKKTRQAFQRISMTSILAPLRGLKMREGDRYILTSSCQFPLALLEYRVSNDGRNIRINDISFIGGVIEDCFKVAEIADGAITHLRLQNTFCERISLSVAEYMETDFIFQFMTAMVGFRKHDIPGDNGFFMQEKISEELTV